MKRKLVTRTRLLIGASLLLLVAAFQLAERWAAKPSMAAGKAPAVQSPERFSLNVVRRGHTMTALPDGRVVIIGGENESGAVAEVEILDSSAGSLAVASRSLTARSRHTATLLSDGRVLVIGGTAQSKLLNSTEWLDPATGEFTAGPRLNRARAGHTATELPDGRLLVTGGNAEGSAEMFDPSAGRFTLLRAKLDNRPSFHAAALLANGNVLLAGGVAQDGRWLRSAELFDASTLSFEPVAEKMWIKRVQPAMRLLPDGKVQVIGGDYDGTMEVYDPARNSFRGAAHLLPTADIFPAANVLTSQTREALIDGLTPPGAEEKNAAGKSMTAHSKEVEAAINSVDGSIDRTDYATAEIAGRNKAVVAGGVAKDGSLTKSVVVMASSTAKLTSDKVEYQQGETPVLSGSGWQPEERVQIVRQNARPGHKREAFNVVANGQGKISLALPAAGYADGMTYTLTAMGEVSGHVAQTVYSEARIATRQGPDKIAYSFPLSFRDGSVETDAGIWIWEIASGGPQEPPRPPASPFAAPESGFTKRFNFDGLIGQPCLGIPSAICKLPSGVDVKLKQGSFLEIGGSVEGDLNSTARTAKAFLKEKLNTDLQFDITAVGTFNLAQVTLPGTGATINASLGGTVIGATLDFGVKATLKLQFNQPGTTFVTGFKLNEEAQIGVEADTSGIRPILSAENPTFTPVFNVTSSNGGCIILTLGPEVDISANLLCVSVQANTSVYTFAKACLTYSNNQACRARTFTVDVGIAGALAAGVNVCEGLTYDYSPPEHIFGQYNIYKDGPTLVGADTEPPVLSAAIDRKFVNNDSGQCSAVVEYPLPSFRDNCSGLKEGSLECTPPSGSSFPVGSTEIKCSASDNFGNIGRTSFFVQVEDIERPVLQGSIPNVTQPADPGKCSAVVNFPLPQVKDNCPAFVETSIPSGSTFPVGTTKVTVRVRQAGQTTGEWPFTVTVLDTQGPTFNSCPANITVPTDRGKCSAVVNFNLPTATDACGGDVVVTSSIKSGSTFPAGTTPVVVTATDASGNKTTCTFNVIVEDKEAPTITCPPDVTKETDPGKCSAVVNFDFTVLSVNNCRDAVNFSFSHESGSAFPVGTTTVTVKATDQSGNSTSCSFTVTVVDKQAPTIACPVNITQSTDPGQCSAVVRFAPTVTDNCLGQMTVTTSIASGTAFQKGTTPVTVSAIDAAGNQSTCTFTVTIVDREAPVLVCPANIVQSTDRGQCAAVIRFALPVATDNCPGVTVTSSIPSASVFQKGTTPVTLTATDEAGNKTTCTFTVTVVDNELPVLNSCPTNITQSTDPGQCAAVVSFALPTATDNCPGVIVASSIPSGTAFPKGTTTVTVTATDASGNRTACSFTVTVVDTEVPVIGDAWPSPAILASPDGRMRNVTVNYPATDNCPGAINSLSVSSSENSTEADWEILSDHQLRLRAERKPNGNGRTYTITINSTDAAGNQAVKKTVSVKVPR